MLHDYERLRTWLAARLAGAADDRGAGLIEYALLMALIALVCITAVALLGEATSTQMGSGADAFSTN